MTTVAPTSQNDNAVKQQLTQVNAWTPSSAITLPKTACFNDKVGEFGATMEKALKGKTNDDRESGAAAVAAMAKEAGVMAFARETDLANAVLKGLQASGKKDDSIRCGAIGVFAEVVKVCGKAGEVVMFPCYQEILNLCGDKKKRVRELAVVASRQYLDSLDKNMSAEVLPMLFNSNTHLAGANENRLVLMSHWVQNVASKETGFCLVDAIPAIAGDVHDANKDVAKAAKDVLKWLLATCGNPDVVPLLDDLAVGLMDLSKISDTVYSLASKVFIQDIDTPTLAIMSPILSGGLAQAQTPVTKRACARIIENMSKLVEEPRDLAAFVGLWMPLLEKAKNSVAKAEVREVCEKSMVMFAKKSDVNKSLTNDINKAFTMDIIQRCAAECVKGLSDADTAVVDGVFSRVATMLVMLNSTQTFDVTEWEKSVKPYFAIFLNDADASGLTASVLETAQKLRVREVESKEEVTDAEELCACPFSLAYGNKVLLKKTKLTLHRGFKYGLMGPNDCGKTSLMRAIADNQIDGLPPPEELRTVFVETDVQGELSHLSCVDYMFEDPLLKDCGVSREDMTTTLQSVGFCDGSPANVTTCVGELSGGWRMKLALARAMLLNADILLLDEPTNHLDVHNVKWLQDYLLSIHNTTVIVVSHDVKLLDKVCDHIIHIEDFKLENFKGNLSDFVKVYPEAKCYFELVSTKFSFKFPSPGKIPGINSKGKCLMKMDDISFTYPGVEKPQLKNVSVQVCLASRTGIVGVNGAGKSTMIRLLMGELEPNEGSGKITKHPNCRVGYIAQHAFHHIENHLDKTCNEYIRWRYQTGDDREALVKVTAIMTQKELDAQAAVVEIPYFDTQTETEKKMKTVIEQVFHTRQKNRKKGCDEFECQLKGSTARTFLPRKILAENGWLKLLTQIDERIALRETMFARPLTLDNVTSHMNDIGLADEFSTHMKIGALSTGQKVKVVLGAALWNQPHILILDEPTNYLDRDSLGALAGAIREFDGGVIMISHNSQFVDTLCTQMWHLEHNTLNVKGDADWMRDAKKIKLDEKEGGAAEEESVDRFGNTVVLKKQKKKAMTNKEKRELARRRKNAKKNGSALSAEEDAEDYE
jgi:elongation factor 3